jgi:hypothetical protein
MRALLATLAIGAVAATAAIPAFAEDPLAGTYEASATNLKVTVDVAENDSVTLRYAAKTKCGNTRGRLSMGKLGKPTLKAKRLSRAPGNGLRVTQVKVRASGDGLAFEGKLVDKVNGGEGRLKHCRDSRSFKAELPPEAIFNDARDSGHYEGTNDAGLAISFDVVRDAGGASRVANLSAEVMAECYDERSTSEEPVNTVVRIEGLSGSVSKLGEVDIRYAPDEDTSHEVSGRITGDEARFDVSITGLFDELGNPDPAGVLSCDSFGSEYSASQR